MSLTWGLDVSTNKSKTAAVALDWSREGRARVVDVIRPLSAWELAPLIAGQRGSSWAVDVPFGWPDLFVRLMLDRHDHPLPASAMPADADWDRWRTRQVAQRQTDRFVTEHPAIRTRPLPASFQLLGATAAMWVLVEAQLVSYDVSIDRSGITGTICETYPAAALAAWGLGRSKRTWEELRMAFDFLETDPELVPQLENDDACDAVVCALIARAREQGLTLAPPAEHLSAARREGWIHVCCEPSTRLVEIGRASSRAMR